MFNYETTKEVILNDEYYENENAISVEDLNDLDMAILYETKGLAYGYMITVHDFTPIFKDEETGTLFYACDAKEFNPNKNAMGVCERLPRGNEPWKVGYFYRNV